MDAIAITEATFEKMVLMLADKPITQADLFDAIASIEDSNFVGKPNLSAFSGFFEAHGVKTP